MRLTTSPDAIAELRASYNVAPSQISPIVRQDAAGNREAALARWGLVPFWADDPAIGNRLINARSEDAAVKPAFRAAAVSRRCLVPADGFYEWQVVEGSTRKQPWFLRVRDAELFAFAGLWERWSREGTVLETFTILTGKPNDLVAPIHDRMPVIVRPESYDTWLDGRREDWSQLRPVLEPFPSGQMEAYRVGTRVNRPENDDASLMERDEGGPAEPMLF
jgi:putative SOS response-associated peptidase YedK